MSNRNQDPNQLNSRVNRRAMIAGSLLGLSLIGATAKKAEAQPTSDHPSAALNHETIADQSPETFLSRLDKRLLRIQSQIRSTPGAKLLDPNDKDFTLPAGTLRYTLILPNKHHHGHYDWLEVSSSTTDKVPKYLEVITNADTNDRDKLITSKGELCQILLGTPTDDSLNRYTAKAEFDHAKYGDIQKYTVSSRDFDGKHPPFGEAPGFSFNFKPISYSTANSKFNMVFSQAEGILKNDIK